MNNEEYLNLVNAMNNAAKLYYEGKETQFTDDEWDQLMKALEAYEVANPDMVAVDSPTQKVNEASADDNVVHAAPMLSLKDIFNETDMNGWLTSVADLEEVCVEPKIDGLSLEVIYDKGKLISGSTRGNGLAGVDVLAACLKMEEIPNEIQYQGYLSVRHEVYMPSWEFRLYVNNVAPAKNARNLAVGLLKRKDGGEAAGKYLHVWAFDILAMRSPEETNPYLEITTHSEALHFLATQGFTTIPSTCVPSAQAYAEIEKIKEGRFDLPYGIDGAVVKLNSLAKRKELGDNGAVPRWAVAYKYPSEEARTKIIEIEYSVGKTGRIAPVAILEPVDLQGTTVSRCTLHNYSKMRALDVRVGDIATIHKAGDIVPRISHCEHTPESQVFSFVEKCPGCGEDLVKYECVNPYCEAKVRSLLVNWVGKSGLDVPGVSKATIDKLLAGKMAKLPGDLYDLSIVELRRKCKLTTYQAIDLRRNMKASQDAPFAKLIQCLSISGIGASASAIIAEKVRTWDDMYELTEEQCIELLKPSLGAKFYAAIREEQIKAIIDSVRPYFPY